MQDVAGKTAFITGGANGVGFGMATVFAEAGMKVVIADIRGQDLELALARLHAHAGSVHAIRLDVTDRAAMAAAADEAERVFGKLHLLCNNAGINVFGDLDQASFDDYDWIFGVNLFGVINGIVTFLPKLKAHGEPAHIVNTASMASIVSGPGAGVYTAAKFAVRGLSECLWYALAPQGIGVSVLCPGLVDSKIHDSESLRPTRYSHSGYHADPEFAARLEQVQHLGMAPREVAEKTLRGIRNNELYIFPHADHREEVRELFDEILGAFPDETPDPERFAFERVRQSLKAEVRARGIEVLKNR